MWPHGTSVIVADRAVARTALFHQQELDPHGSHAGAPGRATPNTGFFLWIGIRLVKPARAESLRVLI
jgi:hypothetical protein